MEPTYYIDAILEFDIYEMDVAAARIEQREGLKDPFSADELADYCDFIDNVYSAIASFGFDMLMEYQSTESYAYYIEFKPKDEKGKDIEEVVLVKFRIADHQIKNRGHDNFNQKTRRVFRSFVLGGERYDNPISLIQGVEKVCEAIQRKDFSGLMKY